MNEIWWPQLLLLPSPLEVQFLFLFSRTQTEAYDVELDLASIEYWQDPSDSLYLTMSPR
jgi:hypothetical protein